MAFGTLFGIKGNPRTNSLLVVAKANNLEVNFVEADAANPSPEHKKANPLGKIPAFIGEDGYALSEVMAIAIYFTSQNEKTSLLGKTKQDYASILRWMSYFNSEVLTPLGGWFRPLLGRDPYNKKSVDDNAKAAQKAIDAIEEHLTHNTYLVSERITLADIFAASIIRRGFEFFFDKKWRSNNPATYRWFDTITNQEIWTAVVDKLEYLDAPKLTNVAPKKAEAPKPAPAAAAAPEEPAPLPKPKHPLESLPKPTMPIDEWKRKYSNTDTPEAMQWFWENVNFEEYSIWKFDYKYNDELTLTFMSNNLIGGFFTRLEGSRKYIFAAGSVYGENNDNVIQGAILTRGQEILPAVDVAPDFESYDFVKLDPTKEEDKTFLNNAWGWESGITVNGKEYSHADGKVFK